jgi:hypothetical protein
MDRLTAALADGAAYEGQQIAKTVAARLRARGGDAGAADAGDLLERGAAAQLAAGQVRALRMDGWGACVVFFFFARPLVSGRSATRSKPRSLLHH